MKVLEKAKMSDGTDIQIEDWKKDYPGVFDVVTLVAYPKAKMTSRYGWIQRGERFRLEMSRGFNTDEEVYMLFKELKEGKTKLEQLDNHYWNGDRDRFYMGFESVPEEPRGYEH